MIKYHETKTGALIKLTELKMSHLQNILKWIERKAKEGLTIRVGGGHDAESMYYDEWDIFGDEAKEYLNYSSYEDELKRRLA